VETFKRLFGNLQFEYLCFDRPVFNRYLSGLCRPRQVVHFRNVMDEFAISIEVRFRGKAKALGSCGGREITRRRA
jgi:hypothetical protein